MRSLGNQGKKKIVFTLGGNTDDNDADDKCNKCSSDDKKEMANIGASADTGNQASESEKRNAKQLMEQ